MDFTKNNLWWDRRSYQNSVVTFGEHYESLTESQRELYCTGCKADFEMCGRSNSRVGLQYLIHFDNYYRRLTTGST